MSATQEPTRAAANTANPASAPDDARTPATIPENANALALGGAFEEDAGAGFGNADRDSFALPFLMILQSGSPQVKKSDGAYIKGAEEGMLFDSVFGAVYDGNEGVLVLPVWYERCYNEWAPRSAGGGFRGRHSVDDVAHMQVTQNEMGQDVLPNGNLITDTRNHYVLIITPDGSYRPAIVSMSSTQVKKSRKWMTVLEFLRFTNASGNPFKPPAYASVFRLTTVPESNDKGTWFGWKIERVGTLEDVNGRNEARALLAQCEAGTVKVSEPLPQGSGSVDDDNIPF